MSVSDPIADALTKIRNAYRAAHQSVTVNHSNIVEDLIKILDGENFINGYELIERQPEKKILRKKIRLSLRYTNSGVPILKGIERISKPGRRVYVDSSHIPSVFNNTGCAILSTSKGVIVDRAARELHTGGEYICKVW